MNENNSSFENDNRTGSEHLSKIKTSLPEFIWKISALSSNEGLNIPKFLKSLKIFQDYSILELNQIGKVLFVRKFEANETIFSNGELGLGFYIVVRGGVKLITGSSLDENELQENVFLEKGDCFGELALLQERSERNATAISTVDTVMLGLFKPDLDALIKTKPQLAALFLQTISEIIANRFLNLSRDYHQLRKVASNREMVKESVKDSE